MIISFKHRGIEFCCIRVKFLGIKYPMTEIGMTSLKETKFDSKLQSNLPQ